MLRKFLFLTTEICPVGRVAPIFEMNAKIAVEEFVVHHKINDIFGDIGVVEGAAELDAVGGGVIMSKLAAGGAGAPTQVGQGLFAIKVGIIDALENFFKVIVCSDSLSFTVDGFAALVELGLDVPKIIAARIVAQNGLGFLAHPFSAGQVAKHFLDLFGGM